MNWIDLQKIFGAVLGTLLFIMAGGFLAESIYHPVAGEGGGYTIEVLTPDMAMTMVKKLLLKKFLLQLCLQTRMQQRARK